MVTAFNPLPASQNCKTFANYRSAVPGIKSFFKFSEKTPGRACRIRNGREAVSRSRDGVGKPATEVRKEKCDSRIVRRGGLHREKRGSARRRSSVNTCLQNRADRTPGTTKLRRGATLPRQSSVITLWEA